MSDLPRDFRAQAHLLMDERIDYWASEFGAICESPIEVAFATAFMALCHHEVGTAAHFDKSVPLDQKMNDEVCRVLWVQRPLEQYRVDFLVSSYPYDPRVAVVVECDGHDFHERTKQQAARDRSRDRAIQSLGLKVFRFTGSEVYRDAFLCAREVLLEIDRLSRSVDGI